MTHDLAATAAEPKARVGDYHLLNTIGEGSFAKVKLARHLPTGAAVAVKVIADELGSRLPRPLSREVSCMADLRHPNIVQLFEVIETDKSTFLVMEYLSRGSLMDYLRVTGFMLENEAQTIFRQLVSAVQYCHQKGIVHRDLKPENVLFYEDMKVKVVDFGLSAPFDGNPLHTFCGSLPYAAPELFLGQPYDGPPVDVWSLGVVLFELVTGTRPFKSKDLQQLGKKIVSGKFEMPTSVSRHLKNLLRKLMTVNPKDRCSLRDIMPHEWLNLKQEEELLPYQEPHTEDVDPSVIEKMESMGFQREHVKFALEKRIYNKAMGTYLILNTKQPRGKCRKVFVKSYHSQDLDNSDPSPGQEVEPKSSRTPETGQHPKDRSSKQEDEELAGPSTSTKSRKVTPIANLKGGKVTFRQRFKSKILTLRRSRRLSSATSSRSPSPNRTTSHRLGRRPRTASPPPAPPPTPELTSRTNTSSPSLQVRSESQTVTSPPNPEQRSATTSPPSQCGPGLPISTQGSGSTSRTGTPEGRCRGRCCRVVRRCWAFVRKLCLGPTKKGHWKNNRVNPI